MTRLLVKRLPLAHSLYHNKIGDKGVTALAAILNETKITNLKCAAEDLRRRPRAFACVSAPIDTPTLTVPILPLARSLGGNGIGYEGASALAAILKETQITNLGCAAARECSRLCQRPLTHLHTHRSHSAPRSQSQ